MKIYIASFNKKSIINEKGYYLLQVSAENNKDINIGIKDNTGDNISKKNPNYCELTGIYWIWKNTKDKIVGLVHYRRYFYKKIFTFKKKNVLTEDEVKKILKEYDIIVPTLCNTNITVYNQYKKHHYIEDLELCGDILKEKYPEYYKTYKKILKEKRYYPFNMIITNKNNFDKYCTWLFDILFEAQKTINKNLVNRDNYNKRVYGFLSERLFNVWLLNQDLKIKELPVYNIEKSRIKEICTDLIKRFLNIFRGKFKK